MYNSILNFIHNFKLKATYFRQSHQQPADELGMVREVISRLLKRLEPDGQVELQLGEIKVFLES